MDADGKGYFAASAINGSGTQVSLAGTLSVYELAEQQAGWFTDWYVFRQPVGALIFFIAAIAGANRTPLDMSEADSEIVAGFAPEYSGMRFGFLFFAEYVNVFIVSALLVTFFFGAWNAPVDVNWLLAQVGLGPVSVATAAKRVSKYLCRDLLDFECSSCGGCAPMQGEDKDDWRKYSYANAF